ncbi:GntR family transcriptional regulator [Fictibacillus terranigra]|uniref:GntR family transcriptional regulator n=1 Tax=Fictibacillus terranigra TaxID=3058424 RepID=A0ABT8EDP5_9BACL|nr:GntR family transcriptional regulator [Fictibacillus sp. CENA-BCM004]MDN4076050.1 GntR family transcriptional regulator [Fictibacillus sp. CENA-BCM004]
MQSKWVEEDLLSIRERAYRYLKDMILNGEYKAGDRLVERELADKLHISRTPIREALFRLESQGFVKTVPRKGVVVERISEDEVVEVFTILSSLEVLAAKLAAQKMDDKTQLEFDQVIVKLQNLDGLTEAEVSKLHLDTNQILHKAAKSPKLYELLTGLTDYIRIFSNTSYETPGRKEESMKEHLEIMKAVRNKDVEMGEYLTKIHIENSKRAYINYVKQNKKG